MTLIRRRFVQFFCFVDWFFNTVAIVIPIGKLELCPCFVFGNPFAKHFNFICRSFFRNNHVAGRTIGPVLNTSIMEQSSATIQPKKIVVVFFNFDRTETTNQIFIGCIFSTDSPMFFFVLFPVFFLTCKPGKVSTKSKNKQVILCVVKPLARIWSPYTRRCSI